MESLIRASCVNFRFCKRIALLVLVLCFAHPLTVSAQSDLTGFWVFRVPTGDGNFRETFLDLKQEGENITGKLLSGTREIPIADGTFKEGKLCHSDCQRRPSAPNRLRGNSQWRQI